MATRRRTKEIPEAEEPKKEEEVVKKAPKKKGTTGCIQQRKPAKKTVTKKAVEKSTTKKRTVSPAAETLNKKCKPDAKNHLELCVAFLRKNKKANQKSVDKCAKAIKLFRKGEGDRNAGSLKMSLINILAAAERK
mgnify:CR=1 FL=1